jgi:hypothetical protein
MGWFHDLRAAAESSRENESRNRLYFLSADWIAASASGAMMA